MRKNVKRLVFLFAYFSSLLSLFAESGLVLYVDAAAERTGREGTSDSPFDSLEQAIAAAHAYINRQGTPAKNATGTCFYFSPFRCICGRRALSYRSY